MTDFTKIPKISNVFVHEFMKNFNIAKTQSGTEGRNIGNLLSNPVIQRVYSLRKGN
jgi:hypothetical protein